MAPRRGNLTEADRALLLTAAHGHWAGGAIRWMLTTGASREAVCALRWSDPILADPPMADEMRVRRARAEQEAAALGLALDGMPVFLNYLGKPMNPRTFADLVRDMINRQRERTHANSDRAPRPD